MKLVKEQFLGKLTQFSPSCLGTPRKRTLKLCECRSDLLILAFRLLSEEDISTLSWESAASDFCKVSMTSCWSLMMFELNSVARESSVVTEVLIVTRRSIDSSLLSKATWLVNRLYSLVFQGRSKRSGPIIEPANFIFYFFIFLNFLLNILGRNINRAGIFFGDIIFVTDDSRQNVHSDDSFLGRFRLSHAGSHHHSMGGKGPHVHEFVGLYSDPQCDAGTITAVVIMCSSD